MTKEEVIAQAREMRRADELEESQELLLGLLEEHDDDPLVLYEVGGSYDVLGDEKKAIPYYQQAIDAGLEGDDLQECLVCLGSSRRVIGQFEDAIETLQEAVAQFPDNNSGKVFLALAYYSDGQEDEAVSLLLDLLLQTTKDEDILAYADALDYYKDNLDEVWDE
ncbi:MAG: tetratricopeptide repeat protein [Anaerolineae bacterium]